MTNDKIISLYMKALGEEKISEEAWKRIADVNRDILDTSRGLSVDNLKNIQTFLKIGKFELTAEIAPILVNLVNTVGGEIKKLETPKEETKSE